MVFSPAERERYSRHFLLPEFGEKAQATLKNARVVVVGAGGLGSPALLYLTAAGVGTLGIVDFDRVDLSNLQRQVLHSTTSVGTAKVDSALARLQSLNPEVAFATHREALSIDNAMRIFADYDIVLDGTDTYATRYLINDACVLLGKPNVSATVFRFEGQLSLFGAPDGPCYRCLYPEPPEPGTVPSCGEGGVLGVVPGVLGTLQASECIKYLTGVGETLAGKLFCIDLLTLKTRMLKFPRDKACAVCGESPSIDRLLDVPTYCATPVVATSPEIAPAELQHRLLSHDDFVLLDVRTPEERIINAIQPSLAIPLAELQQRLDELPKDKEIVVYCKSGMRSAKAATMLSASGHKSAKSLAGGMMRWIEEIDPTLQRY